MSEAATSPRLVVRVGARRLALDASEIDAVARRPTLSRVPGAPAALLGLAALKGRATPVFDLARLLGEADAASGPLVALRGEPALALAVDRIDGFRVAADATAERLDPRPLLVGLFQPAAPRAHSAREITRAEPAQEAGELSYLPFALAGQRFAFPIDQVSAVLRAVEILELPGADPLVRGVTPYRDGVLPIVELAELLALPAPARGPENRIFVVEIAGLAVGLRVERALGALRVNRRDVSPAPALLNRGAGEAEIAAIVRTRFGLTAALSSDRLLDEATMRRLGARAVAGRAVEPAASTRFETVVVFRVGAERYALPAGAVEAVERAPRALSRPPDAPPFLAGLASRRGEITPLIDQRLRFGAPASAASNVVFVRSGVLAAGLMVDAVERLARLRSDGLERAPAIAGDAGALFAKVSATEHDGRPLLVADVDSLLGHARRDLLDWAGRPA